MSRTIVRLTVLFSTLAALLVLDTRTNAQRAHARTEQVDGREAAAGEVLLKFRRPPQPDLLTEIRSLTNAEAIQTIGRAGLRRLRARALDVPALLELLANHPDVLYAEPNYIVHAFTEPNDPSFPQLWGLRNTGQTINGSVGVAGADIHAVDAWGISFGSTAQIVAVIDTGIDYTHPDLTANVWSAPAAFSVNIDGVTVTCPAGSHGFNAITLTCDPMDDHNHGTHVSGTIGASGGNGVGVVGVNWTTQVMGIKFLDATGSGTEADAIKAIDFAIQAKRAFSATGGANVRVLSNSWGGGDFSQALLDEINAANAEDMLFVAAAGNNGFDNDILPTYPGSYDAPNVIAVAATTNTDGRAFFSNYGAASVQLGAPGFDILSTTIGNTYAFFSGTSMATPHVSGAAALVLSHCAFDTAALKDALLATVEPIPSLASITTTGGRLDVYSAIRSCEAPTAPPTLTALAGDGKVTLTWSGAAGTTAFAVKRSTTSGGPYVLLAPDVKGKTYVDTNVVNGTTYYYVVSAKNTVGESGDSNEVSATPKSPSDLVVSAITTPQNAGADSPMVLSVTIKNQGPGTSVPTTTRFYLSTNWTLGPSAIVLDGIQTVPSLAPGATSAASVTVNVPAGLAAAVYYLFAKADADNVESESSEANNTLVRLVWIGPDLIVTSLTGPSSAAGGGTIVVTDTVKNQGGGASAASTTRFYLSADAAFDASDVPLAGSRSVPGLAAGATSVGSTSLLIPSTALTGSYYLIAKADADNTAPETQESNNTRVKSLQIGGDLVVSAVSAPSNVGAGSTIVVTDTTTNQGGGTVAASITRFYLSHNTVLDASATLLAGGRAVPDLAAGTGSTGSTTLVIPSSVVTGSYYFLAKADADSANIEALEGNNTAARSITVGGDLIVSALTVPSSAAAGSTILVNDTTTNQRAGTVAASVTRFYLSANTLLDASDVLLAGSRMVPELAAGATSAGPTNLTLPSTVAPGAYYIIAKADADNAAAETDEANNTIARTIQIGGDLVVSSLTVPPKGGVGGTIIVSDTTTNLGAAAVAASATRFYLSTDTILNAPDMLLSGARSVPALAAGAGSAGSSTLSLPTTISVGVYYLIAKADGDNVVAEAQEANNTNVRSIAIGPDLTVGGLTIQFTIAAGATVLATDTVQNSGADPAGPSTTRFYLSANLSLDASDVLLASSRAVPGLAAGGSSTGSTAVTIPASTVPGVYYLFAVVDADGAVTEAQENNNNALRAIQVVAGS
jgi:subtilisin family serine protease